MSTNLEYLREAEEKYPESERESFLNRFVGAISMRVDLPDWLRAIEAAHRGAEKK